MLAGTRQPQRGTVTLDGAPLTRFRAPTGAPHGGRAAGNAAGVRLHRRRSRDDGPLSASRRVRDRRARRYRGRRGGADVDRHAASSKDRLLRDAERRREAARRHRRGAGADRRLRRRNARLSCCSTSRRRRSISATSSKSRRCCASSTSERGVAIVISTHDLGFAGERCAIAGPADPRRRGRRGRRDRRACSRRRTSATVYGVEAEIIRHAAPAIVSSCRSAATSLERRRVTLQRRFVTRRSLGFGALALAAIAAARRSSDRRRSPAARLRLLASRSPTTSTRRSSSSRGCRGRWPGAIVGAPLASAGVVFQGLLRNPLATPFTLGVSTGAALGAMLAITFNWTFGVAGFPPCRRRRLRRVADGASRSSMRSRRRGTAACRRRAAARGRDDERVLLGDDPVRAVLRRASRIPIARCAG